MIKIEKIEYPNEHVKEKNNIYEGGVKDGRPHGRGTETYPSEAKYVGEFKDGKRHGQGTYTWAEGDQHIGEYKDGNANGQGTLTLPDGTKYDGEFKDGVPNGKCTLTFPDGTKNVGEFKDGEPNGQCTYTSPEGLKYVGEMKNGLRHGYGTETYPDGNIYQGEYKDDRRKGKGTYKHHNGTKYVGEYKDGVQHGQGKVFAPDNTLLQEGEWFEGEFNDLVTFPRKGTKKPDVINYEGDSKDGKPHGFGTATYSNGSKYVGEFKDGQRHGRGTYYAKFIGTELESLWHEDKPIADPTVVRGYTGKAIRPEDMDSDDGWPRVSIWYDREKKREEYDLEDKWTVDILKKNLRNRFRGSIDNYGCFVMSPLIKMSEEDFVRAFTEFCKENNRKGHFEESSYKTKSFVFDDDKLE